ncbi:MAG: hypothetical protein CVU98_12450 [Firmicutes bacterium HGW-Firmicutes-3]|nr:MAG: hypothetical protein CVU98_12450 [Firmicutes bacterium HGW-Firmicutes-3]
MCGILSEDSDITEVYADGLLRQAHIDDVSKTDALIKKLKAVSDKFDVRFVFSLTCDACNLPEFLEEFLIKA